MPSSAETRQSEILDVLTRERYLKVAELSLRFGVSQMSIRRDLALLEQQGLLRRVHGGMVATPLSRLGLEISPDFITQLKKHYDVKEAIARLAAGLVQPGDHLIFDSGDISYLVACALSGDLLTQGKLAAITNSIPVALELSPWPGVVTILMGGEYRAGGAMSLSGADTLRGLDGLHADKMFLTAAAIDFQEGVNLQPLDGDVELAKRMVAACSRVILLAPGSVIGRARRSESLHLSPGHSLVTDCSLPAAILATLQAQGLDVIQVKPVSMRKLCL
jgi:DeoR/GlpR family transcriptional regulator of sugar metabolism